MSYPPGVPPMGMGQRYGYPPMGMMGMGMAPPLMKPTENKKKLVPQEIPKQEDEKPPVTTVFVGNISDKAPDTMVRQMLLRCGNVLSWKRVQGASGKLQAFGFCEYERPEATLRCIRLLNDWEIADKKLVVKVDSKTKVQLEEYQEQKRKELNNDEISEEFSQREDRVARAGLDAIMKEYAAEISKNTQIAAKREAEAERQKKQQQQQHQERQNNRIRDIGLDDIDESQKSLIHREISSFRALHKGEDVEEDPTFKELHKERKREREERIRYQRGRNRSDGRNDFMDRGELVRNRDEVVRGRDEVVRSRDEVVRSRDEVVRSRDDSDDRERESRMRARERENRRRKSKSKSRSPRARSIERGRDRFDSKERRDRDDMEEEMERKKLERKLREKESAYQERLKAWQQRERKKTREFDKEKDREEDRKLEEAKEARRLKEFLEDYDDERDDPKFYKGSSLNRRLKDREKEAEADNRDRQREKEEIEEIRKKLLEEGHPDPEAELAKMEEEREKKCKPDIVESEPEPIREQSPALVQEEPHPAQSTKPPLAMINPAPQAATPSTGEESPEGIIIPETIPVPLAEEDQSFIGPSIKDENRISFPSLKISGQESPDQNQSLHKRKKMSVVDVFNNEEDDGDATVVKKRKLVPLDYGEEERAAHASKTSDEEKRKMIKNLIEKIPTAKEELFAYVLAWDQVNTGLMETRIKPWVNKKILEYIGEEEPTLTEFICQKVMAHSLPQSILNDVAMVLDEEAEVFVVKMWRLLIYETEAKKAGLVKGR